MESKVISYRWDIKVDSLEAKVTFFICIFYNLCDLFKIKPKVYHCSLWHTFPKSLWLRLSLYEKVQCLSCVWHEMGLKFLEREREREGEKEGRSRVKERMNKCKNTWSMSLANIIPSTAKMELLFLFFSFLFFEGRGPLLLWSSVSKIYLFNIFRCFSRLFSSNISMAFLSLFYSQCFPCDCICLLHQNIGLFILKNTHWALILCQGLC